MIRERRKFDVANQLVHPILDDQPRGVIERCCGVLPLLLPHERMLT